MLNYFLVTVKVKKANMKNEILPKPNLKNVESLIWNAIQECYISENDYAFIIKEVDSKRRN